MKTFAIIHTALTAILILLAHRDASTSLGYGFALAIFWVSAGLILAARLFRGKVTLKSRLDYVFLIFSTPIPAFAVIGLLLFLNESASSIYEFDKNGYRYKIKYYDYSNGKRKRLEFYRSSDSVGAIQTRENNSEWVKDSVWIYFDSDGSVEKTVNYGELRNGSR